MVTKRPYIPSQHSADVNEAAHAAWLKLSDDEQAALQASLDNITLAQLQHNQEYGSHTNTIATGGIELLAKLGMFLNGVNYAEFINDEMKGQRK